MSVHGQSVQIGMVLEGRYRIVSKGSAQDLATGYRAYDMRDDRLVEVLVLPRRLGADPAALSRVSRANQAVASLQQAELVPFEHVGLAEGWLYCVRAPVDGRRLADLLAQVGSLKVQSAVEITIRLCEALAPAHRAGLVHGGLSARSVLVRVDDRSQEGLSRAVAVLDAGLLPALRPTLAPPGQPWGPLPYLSPEQAAGGDVQPASDVYVIGALLYEMLTGRPPFQASAETVLIMQHLRQEPPSLQILLPQIPESLAQIVHKALAKEPAARYRNAGQLAHILCSQAGVAPGARPPARMADAIPLRHAQSAGRLVVPAPPPPAPVAVPAAKTDDARAAPSYQAGEAEGVDWILVGLIIVALIAVLGLLPLWRAVYRRYAPPPPASESGFCPIEGGASSLTFAGVLSLGADAPRAAAMTGPRLAYSGLVLYNSEAAIGYVDALERALPDVKAPVSLGVQLTGFAGKLG